MHHDASLWPVLLGLLRGRGELPLQHEVMTPDEIAAAVELATGDRRTRRFVWDYYYPQLYGGQAGLLSEDEARALVESFKPRPLRPAVTPSEQPATVPEGDRCGVCHSRAVRHQG